MTADSLTTLVQNHGLLILFPLSIAEGPVVSALAGWLVKLGLLPLLGSYVVLVLGDLIGDGLHYALGRFGGQWLPQHWRHRLGLDHAGDDWLKSLFAQKGGRTLVLAKLTHSLGFAALIGAGAARMPFGRFLWFNLLGTLPKSAGFMALGYALGHVSGLLDSWILRLTVIGAVLAVVLLIWVMKSKGKHI